MSHAPRTCQTPDHEQRTAARTASCDACGQWLAANKSTYVTKSLVKYENYDTPVLTNVCIPACVDDYLWSKLLQVALAVHLGTDKSVSYTYHVEAVK